MMRYSLLFLVVVVAVFTGCVSKDTKNPANVVGDGKTLALSIPLPKVATGTLLSASILIWASDMDSITCPLTMARNTISGTVQNIPLGYSRKIEISVYDNNSLLAYYGEATIDILSNKAVSVTIELKEVKGTVIINGIISDDCAPFVSDVNTLALYHFDESSSYELLDAASRTLGNLGTGTRISGRFDGGLGFSNGAYSSFVSDTVIPNGQQNGTVECFFKFNDTWDSTGAYAIFGNNGARCLLVYKNRAFHFIKNHSNIFKQVSGCASVTPGKWYHIAATWGSKGMRVFLDGELLGTVDDKSNYQSSPRGISENTFYIGRKTFDGMEGVGIYTTIGLEGSIDEVRISSIERY